MSCIFNFVCDVNSTSLQLDFHFKKHKQVALWQVRWIGYVGSKLRVTFGKKTFWPMLKWDGCIVWWTGLSLFLQSRKTRSHLQYDICTPSITSKLVCCGPVGWFGKHWQVFLKESRLMVFPYECYLQQTHGHLWNLGKSLICSELHHKYLNRHFDRF